MCWKFPNQCFGPQARKGSVEVDFQGWADYTEGGIERNKAGKVKMLYILYIALTKLGYKKNPE